MSKLDFAHFKKIHQDKKIAKLLHPDGHEIKIAISGLSPDMRKKLDKLPIHAAEGEDIEAALNQDASGDEPNEVDELIKEEEAKAPVQETAPEQQSAPPTAQPQAPSLEPTQPVPAAEPAAAPAPQPAQEAAPAVAPPAPHNPADEAMQRTAENMKFADDLHQGHIEPKTYGSLFHDKGIVGKIGTLFGMMLSGAGSGLAHQQNALLAMMDKQIANDLEAQKTDQSNRQNWYKMSLEHDRNAVANALTGTQVDAASLANARYAWQNGKLGVPIQKLSATTDAHNHSLIAVNQLLQDNINKMPLGPQRDAAQANLDGVIKPAITQKVIDNNKNFASKKAVVSAIKKNEDGTQNLRGPVINEEKFRKGLQFGRDIAGTGILPKGAIPEHDADKIQNEQKELEYNRNNFADYDDAFRKVAGMKMAGQVPASKGLKGVLESVPFFGSGLSHAFTGGQESYERDRNVQLNELAARMHGGTEEERKHTLDSILPSWADFNNPARLEEIHRKGVLFFKGQKAENAPTIKRYGLGNSFPETKYKAPKPEAKKEKGKDW